MNHLLTSIILIIVSVCASADMTGLWIRDWQSAASGGCHPSSFTIDEISQGAYNVSYNFTSSDLVYCPGNFTGSYVSSLTQNATTGTWVDSQGAQLTYSSNITGGIITHTMINGSPIALYDRNGAVIPESTGLGLIGGVWNNPTLINATNQSACCVPENFYIEPESGTLFLEGEIYVNYNYVNSTCVGGGNSSKGENLSIDTPDVNLLNWTGADLTVWAISNFILDPSSSSNQLTVQYGYLNMSNGDSTFENTCFYSYQRSQPQLINGTWLPDWQNYYYTGPSSYQISIVNDTYMISTLNYSNGISKTGAIAVNSENQYYDSVLASTFVYDKTTDSLLSVQSYSSEILLFTKNGSLFSNNMYAANWNNSQSLNTNAACCLPEFLEIGPSHTTPNMYAIAYYFPSNYTQNIACSLIASSFVGDYELLMTLETFPPSFTNLNWVDNYDSRYTFAGNDTSPQLVVSNFVGSGCNFTMSYSTNTNPPNPNPNPNPNPLSSVWMGIDIKFIVFMAISIIFACL